jgi:hypothetical protein
MFWFFTGGIGENGWEPEKRFAEALKISEY